ncbi:MAG: 3'-5' exoribonuclease YhaM family protein [Bacillota bacterium]|jgi:3'-5' exoribonuclease
MVDRIAKTQYASELRPGTVVNSVFLCADVKVRPTKSGSQFADVRLVDRTGEISLKLWNYSENVAGALAPGVFVKIRNVPVTEYNGSLQLSCETAQFGGAITLCSSSECNLADYVPSTVRDVDSMIGEIDNAICNIKPGPIKCLLQSFFGMPEFRGEFMEWPAAVRHHHAYSGGLLEHTTGVLRLCLCAADQYEFVDRDILIAGALLHDVGKLRSYDYDRTHGAATMSLPGVMTDHIVIGVEIVNRRIADLLNGCENKGSCAGPCWTEQETLHITHLIASHHGSLEWGSPVQPATIEACILHHADNMDAQVNKYERTIREMLGTGDGQCRYSEHVGKMVWAPPGSFEDDRS